MAIVTPALISALFTGYNANFEAGKSEAQPQFSKIASVIKSTTASNTYGWLGKFPSLAKWIGDRNIQSMKAHGYTITNEDYESTVGVDRNDIEDDNLGIYAPIFSEMGRSAAIHPDEMVFPLLTAGLTTACYDGQFFFDTDRPVNPEADGSGVVSKQFRYGVDCRDAAGFGFWQMAFANKRELTADTLWDTIAKMREFTADGGRKLAIKPTLLVVPPSLEKLATRLMERELDANSSNELKGRLEILVADYL